MIKKPFVPYKLEGERSKRLNAMVDYTTFSKEVYNAQRLLQQPKIATTIIQLAKIGYKSLLSAENGVIFELLDRNLKNNKRLGILLVEGKPEQMLSSGKEKA